MGIASRSCIGLLLILSSTVYAQLPPPAGQTPTLSGPQAQSSPTPFSRKQTFPTYQQHRQAVRRPVYSTMSEFFYQTPSHKFVLQPGLAYRFFGYNLTISGVAFGTFSQSE